MNMHVNTSVSTFRALMDAKKFGTRDVVVEDLGNGMKVAGFAHVGRCSIRTADKVLNRATMASFRAALQNEHGDAAVGIFKNVVGDREERGKSLRLKDIRHILDRVALSELNEVTRAGGMQPVGDGKSKLTPEQTRVQINREQAALQTGMAKVFGAVRGGAGYELAWQAQQLPETRPLTARDAGKVFSRMREWDVRAVEARVTTLTDLMLNNRHDQLEKIRPGGRFTDEDRKAITHYMRSRIFPELAKGPQDSEDPMRLSEASHLESTLSRMVQTIMNDPDAILDAYEADMQQAKQERIRQANAMMQEMQQLNDSLREILG